MSDTDAINNLIPLFDQNNGVETKFKSTVNTHQKLFL